MRISSTTVSELNDYIDEVAERFTRAGIESPRAEAIRLLDAVLATAKQAGHSNSLEAIEAAVRQREARRSIGRIVGSIRFRGLAIMLNDEVFEPCPTSELLLEHAASRFDHRQWSPRILDIGTGAGNLLLAALHEFPSATGVGLDISPAAVALAEANALGLGLSERAEFRVSDVADECEGAFDLVLSTLPFIPSRMVPTLMPEALLHDPVEALDGGHDGLKCYRKLAKRFREIMKPGGVGLFQFSREYIASAQKLFEKEADGQVSVIRDGYGLPFGICVKRG